MKNIRSRTMGGCTANVAKGIRLDLSALPKRERLALVKFIARVSEVSYRRGFQQGHVFTKSGAIVEDPFVLRYRCHIDAAPWGEWAKDSGRSAIDILRTEYRHAFDAIGLSLSEPEGAA